MGRSNHSLVSSLLLLFISLIVFRGVILTPGTIVFEDINTPGNIGIWFRQMYPMWNEYGSYGINMGVFRLLLYGPVFYIASLSSVSASTLSKAFYSITPFAGGAVTFFSVGCLLRKSRKLARAYSFFPVRKDRKRAEAQYTVWKKLSISRSEALASFTGAAIYMISPAILINQITHYFTWVPYYLQPLLFLSYVKTLEDDGNRKVVLTALVLSFASIEVHYAFFSWLLLLSWLGYSCLRCPTKQNIVRGVKTTGKILFLYILFCAFWVLPLVMTPHQLGTTSSPPSISYVQDQSRQNMFYNVVRLVGGYAYFPASQDGYASMPYLGILPTVCGFIIPMVAFVSMTTNRKNKYALFFSVVLVVSLYLAMGTMAPYPKLYEWLSTRTPIGSLIRKPNKWLYFTSLSYSFIISIGITEFTSFSRKFPLGDRKLNRRSRFLSRSLIIFVSTLTVVSILFAHPLAFNGDFNGILTPVKIPRSFENVSMFLENSDLGESKLLWLPVMVGTKISWNNGRYTSHYFYNQILDAQSIGPYSYCSEYLHFIYDTPIYSNRTAFLGKLLAPLNVKYIIFHDDFGWPGPLGGWNEYSIALSNLNTQKDLKLATQEDFLYVFKNEEETARFFIPSQAVVIDNLDDLNILSLSPQFDPMNVAVVLNETEGIDPKALPITPNNDLNENADIPAKIVGYKRIDPTRYEVEVEAEKPFILAFAEPYTPGWRACVDGKEVENIPLYSAINGFLLYKSGYIKITIEYSPQKWLNLGIAISSVSIVAGLIFLIKPNLAKGLKKSLKDLFLRLRHMPNL